MVNVPERVISLPAAFLVTNMYRRWKRELVLKESGYEDEAKEATINRDIYLMFITSFAGQ